MLQGIKILDLSTLLPGPLCSMFLAELGAEVIKVESPSGDPMRYFENKVGKSPYFASLNRNKKSIVINLKTDEGKGIFRKLAKDADVILEGFRPGKVNSLGIGYEEIRKINPKIIYCSITGYGQKGPLKEKAGHDLNYSALSGLLDVLSEKPIVPGVQIADVGSAMIAAFSIVTSLLKKEREGKGNYIDVSIFDSAISLIGMHIAHSSVSKNKNTILSGKKACYNVYETKDGKFVSLGAVERKFWASFCKVVGRQNLLEKQLDDDIVDEVKRIFIAKDLKEWIALNEKHDFCCEPVKKLSEIYGHRTIIDLDGIKQAALPVIFSSLKVAKHRKAPTLGENSEELLKGCGYDQASIENFRSKKIVP
jgi:crotonobetainyl-CoA:carnitine CoA-transferase CaiB-like acyl-CoA transferase